MAVGTGASIEIGKRGDCDVVFVHAKELELKAVAEGYFVNRHDVMYNDFVLIGPANDPLKIKGLKKAAEALKKIADGSALLSPGVTNPEPIPRNWACGKRSAWIRRGNPGIWRSARGWKRPSGSPMKNGLYPDRPGHLAGHQG